MAIMGGVYAWVEEESVSYPIESTEHTVESGASITSHIRQLPVSIAVNGIIAVDVAEKITHFTELMRGGWIIDYVGRHVLNSVHITDFSTRATNRGGLAFDMTLREMRVARNQYVSGVGYAGDISIEYLRYDGTTTIEYYSEPRERYHEVQPGDTLYNIAESYRSRGVTADGLRALNAGRAIFRAGHFGDFAYLEPYAGILLGTW